MTSLIAWVAVDQRNPSGVYFASDSRRTWDDGSYRDDCIKLFVPAGSTEMFAFAGDVEFPTTVLAKLVRTIEAVGIPDASSKTSGERSRWAFSLIESEFLALDVAPQYPFTILHASRDSFGLGAKFGLFTYRYSKIDGKLSYREMVMPIESSAKIEATGTGKDFIDAEVLEWEAGTGKVSRAYFSAFCDSLGKGADPKSGGPIQLAGIGCSGTAMHFGVVIMGKPYYRGSLNTVDLPPKTKWRNALFEVVDSTGSRIRRAKIHARPK